MTIRLFLLLPILLASSVASPVGLVSSPDGSKIYVAMERTPSVVVVDTSSRAITGTWTLPAPPRELSITRDGTRLLIPAGIAPGSVVTMDSADGKILHSLPCGHSPRQITISQDGSIAYICNQFVNRIEIIQTTTRKVIGHLPATREPVASALSTDGHTLFVANLLPSGRADTGNVAAEVSAIDTGSGKTTSIPLPNGSTDARALTLSHDGNFIYLVHTLAHYNLPTTQLDRGWMNTSAMTVIDARQHRLIATVLLDDIDLGAANPAGIACSPDGRLIAIAHAGTHELSIIDRSALHNRIDKAARNEVVTEVTHSLRDIPNDLAFLHGIRKRIKLAGNGPRAIIATKDGFAAACFFSRTLHLVKVASDLSASVTDIALAPPVKEDPAHRGEQLFFDATRCFQQWQSCASCHPGVRTDGLNWDLLNDGVGNPKQTKSLLHCMETPPSMISGIRPNAETAIRTGMRYILFATQAEEDAHAIEAYLRALGQVPSPALVNGQMSPSAVRGEKIFIQAECAKCHSGPYLTDGHPHNVHTGIGSETDKAWDTPTLREIWRTAPYLYDGRAATLEDVIGPCNSNDTHGKTSTLTPAQRQDLIDYLRSL